jgi:hypothetical protein
MAQSTERILITVRTYPVISTEYIETVCTGGITDDGEWRRLYPVSWRYLEQEKQYGTYDVVEVQVKNGKDTRPESRTPVIGSLRIVSKVKTWQARREWIEPTMFESMQAMIEAERSLAPVRVREVLEFIANPTEDQWNPAQLEKLKQAHLFEERKPLEKVPYDFRLRWVDGRGVEYNSHVMAWEFGEAWRAYRRRYDDAVAVMREKWMNDLCGPQRDVAFFMGNQNRFRDQFSVCGIFCPPKDTVTDDSLWGSIPEAAGG